MAKLQPAGVLKRIELPSSKDEPIEDDRGWIVLETGAILAGDILNIKEMTTDAPLKMQFPILVNRIKEWNMKDVDGEVAAINESTVSRLAIEDLTILMGELFNSEGTGESAPLVPTTSGN